MVFVLDNYDSFTYNLVQYMGELGAEVMVRRNDELTPEEVEALNPERILLSPGIEFDFHPLMVYADVELPVYERTTGDQLIGSVLYKLIVSYKF